MGRDVLIMVELRRLGDAVISIPFVRGAALRYNVHVLCHPSSVPVFETLLPRDRIISMAPPWIDFSIGSLIAMLKTARHVRLLHPRVTVCGWADARVEWVMLLIGAPRRVGFPMTPRNYYAWQVPWRRRNLRHGRWLSRLGKILTGRNLLTDPLFRRDDAQSHLLDWAQVGESLGISLDTSLPWIRANKNHLEPSVQAEILRLRTLGAPLWIVHPGAGSVVKQWGNDRFKKLIHSFFAVNNIPCVVIHPPGDSRIEASGAHVFVYRPPNLESLMAMTSEADAIVCNDSAMSHLAAAMGKRVVAIFGPSDPRLFAPFANENNVVIKGSCRWRPCMDRCRMPASSCIELIEVDDVASKVQRVHAELLGAKKGVV